MKIRNVLVLLVNIFLFISLKLVFAQDCLPKLIRQYYPRFPVDYYCPPSNTNPNVRVINARVLGNIAYLSVFHGLPCETGNPSRFLQIIDVTDPQNPIQLGSYGSLSEPVYSLYDVSANTAYMGGPDGSLLLIDVSNPGTPALLSRYKSGWINDVYVVGNTAYVVDMQQGLLILDVTNPKVPILVGKLFLGNSYPNRIYVSGNRAYVGGAAVPNVSLRFYIIDITNSATPVLVGRYEPPDPITPISDIYVVGNTTAYVTMGTYGLLIIDVTKSIPVLLGRYYGNLSANDVEVSGNSAYVSVGPVGLQVIDVVNPIAPSLIGSYVAYVDAANSYDSYGGEVSVSGNIAYMAEGLNGLEIIDVSGCGTNNIAPIANAGLDQTVHPSSIVTLDASTSSDPDGNVPLSYNWGFSSVPAGSTATLLNLTSVNPTFTPDIPGDYVIQLVVTDSLGAASAPDPVTISTLNSAPVAEAGADQSIIVIRIVVRLDGTLSYDVDGDTITYQWAFVSRPTGSTALLAQANTATPTFVADVYGDYVIQLLVSDPWTQSVADTVIVSFTNVAPVANAGTSQSVIVGVPVTLDGSRSSDANGDLLAYRWVIISAPLGSTAAITNPTAKVTTFVPDLTGTYVLQLIVNDGYVDSIPSTVQVQAVTLQTIAVQTIQNCQTQIASLSQIVFKNPNMQNTFLNKLNTVIVNIEAGNYADALGQLQNDILAKTDGCATTGVPDKNDWIKDCESQGIIYPCIIYAITSVEGLL